MTLPRSPSRTCGRVVCRLLPVFLLAMSVLLPARAAVNELRGTYFESTRLIYPEGAVQGKSVVLNNNSDRDFLLQTLISPPDAKTGLPGEPVKDFLVTPPLMRLAAHQSRTLRLLRTGGQFPADRESVFWLTASLIPGEDEADKRRADEAKVVVKYLTAVSIKVFWRPRGLDKPHAVEEAAGKLKASIAGGRVTLTNPTPYYVTLRTLSVGEANVPSQALVPIVPPFGHQDYPLPAGMKRSAVTVVSWTAVKENGFDTTPFIAPVAVSGGVVAPE